MPIEIINDRIDGLRVTVLDVFYYLENGRTPEEIINIFAANDAAV